MIRIKGIKDILGSASRLLSNLCTDANINKWSKWKPVKYNKDCEITALDLYSINYVLIIPIGAATPLAAAALEYIYKKPTGGTTSPYRL